MTSICTVSKFIGYSMQYFKRLMDFPLFAQKYEVHGRIYRRNPSKRARNDFDTMGIGGDTADLYSTDEEVEGNSSYVEQSNSVPGSCPEGGEFMANVSHNLATSENYPVVFNENSKKWSTKVLVPSELVRFVVGARAATKKKIEEETGCRILIPSKDKQNPLEIFSKSEEGLKRCKDRIELIVMNARDKVPYTHFVSFSAAVTDIQNSFAEFAEKVKNDEELSETCRDDDLFQEPKKLHFTIVMLSLLDSNERKAALKVLEEIVELKIRKLLSGKPLDMEVRGVEYMNDDPLKVNVLYAVARSNRLQQVADEIAKGMKEAGFSRQQDDSVKLHLTLMNTRYATRRQCRGSSQKKTSKRKKWEKGKKIYMDVTKLLEKYSDFNFGHCTVTEVHISSLNDPKDEDGYYTSVGSVKL